MKMTTTTTMNIYGRMSEEKLKKGFYSTFTKWIFILFLISFASITIAFC